MSGYAHWNTLDKSTVDGILDSIRPLSKLARENGQLTNSQIQKELEAHHVDPFQFKWRDVSSTPLEEQRVSHRRVVWLTHRQFIAEEQRKQQAKRASFAPVPVPINQSSSSSRYRLSIIFSNIIQTQTKAAKPCAYDSSSISTC